MANKKKIQIKHHQKQDLLIMKNHLMNLPLPVHLKLSQN